MTSPPSGLPTVASCDVRAELVEALRLALVGQDNAHAFAHELLPDPPTRWYLTGFLVPADAPLEQRRDETSADEIDSGSNVGGTDDAAPPDRAAARKRYLPSSIGLSVLVPPQVESLRVIVQWGDYHYEGGEEEPEPDDHGPTLEPPPEGGPDALGENSVEYKTDKRHALLGQFCSPFPDNSSG